MHDSNLDEISYVISYSDTRHIVGRAAGGLHSGRITTLCEFGIRPEEALEIATRDCEFCRDELALRKAKVRLYDESKSHA